MGLFDNEDDTPAQGGLLASDQKQILPLSAIAAGLSMLANNRPGMTLGNALGAGGLQGLQTMGSLNAGAANQALNQAKAQNYALQTKKLAMDVANQQRQQQMFTSMFPNATPAVGGAPTQIASLSPAVPGGAAPPSPAAPAQGDSFGAIGLTRDQVQMAYAMGGPPAAQKLIETAAAKRIETGQYVPEERNGVPGQVDKLSGKWSPLDPALSKVTVNPNINMPPVQSEEQKKVGGYFAQTFIDTQEAEKAARKQNNQLDALGDLLDKAYTGVGGETVQSLKRTAKAVGFDIDGVGEGDAAKALGNQMALELRNPAGGAGMPGALSNSDRDFLASMVPGLSQTPEGRKLLVDTYKKINQRNIDVARMARDYRKQNGMLNEGFYDKLAEFSDKNPLFKGATVPKPAGGGADPLGIR